MKPENQVKEILLKVKVIPKSPRNEIVGFENEVLKIRLNAVPEKGEANQQLIKFLSKTFKIPQTQITIIRGLKSRQKTLQIQGLTWEEIENC